jgi:hypothetical protein
MKRMLRLGLAAAVVTGIGCQGTSSESLRCGPGTVERDHECVPDPGGVDAGGLDAASPSGLDAGGADAASPDAGDDGGLDAGPVVHDGDPCPTGYGAGGCSGNRIFHCQHQTATDTGTVIFDAFGDCAVLGGICTTGGILPQCTGGGYTACDPTIAHQHCASPAIVVVCDQSIIDATGKGRWMGALCSAISPSYVCRDGSGGGGCGP